MKKILLFFMLISTPLGFAGNKQSRRKKVEKFIYIENNFSAALVENYEIRVTGQLK